MTIKVIMMMMMMMVMKVILPVYGLAVRMMTVAELEYG